MHPSWTARHTPGFTFAHGHGVWPTLIANPLTTGPVYIRVFSQVFISTLNTSFKIERDINQADLKIAVLHFVRSE